MTGESPVSHTSVLLNETVEALTACGRTGTFLDATFGGGGHTQALLDAHPQNRVVALDCDPDALDRGRRLQENYPERLVVVDLNFRELADTPFVDFVGVLFDFGVSSWHLDDAGRGFSFRNAGPLDMRLDPRKGQTAYEFLMMAGREEIVRAIRDYGEEPKWKAVVRAIESMRGQGLENDTAVFAEKLAEAIGPGNPRIRRTIHPATLSFQGIRIAVNRELESIEQALPVAFERLRAGGRMVAISFHSLEDRIVKRFFRRMSGRPENRFDSRPQQDREVFGKELTRRPVSPGEQEIAVNPRARSARMRVLEKGEQIS